MKNNTVLLFLFIVLFLLVLIFDFPFAFDQESDLFAQANDGISIAYIAKGNGSPTLVFVHGWCCDKTYWKEQLSYFENQYRVIAIDLGGHGNSGSNRDEWTIESFGADVASVINREKLDKIILIGHSMGGTIILETAGLIPGKVIGLIGVDTYHDVDSIRSKEGIEAFLAPFEKDFVKTTKIFVHSMFTPNSNPELIEEISDSMASAPPKLGIESLRAGLSYNVAESLKKLHIPTIAINSDKYPIDLEAGIHSVQSFEIKILKGVGHFVMREDPDAFNKALSEAIHDLRERFDSRVQNQCTAPSKNHQIKEGS